MQELLSISLNLSAKSIRKYTALYSFASQAIANDADTGDRTIQSLNIAGEAIATGLPSASANSSMGDLNWRKLRVFTPSKPMRSHPPAPCTLRSPSHQKRQPPLPHRAFRWKGRSLSDSKLYQHQFRLN
jgi:hypothetical protein